MLFKLGVVLEAAVSVYERYGPCFEPLMARIGHHRFVDSLDVLLTELAAHKALLVLFPHVLK